MQGEVSNMLAAKLFDKNDIRLVQVEIPRINEGEVLMKVRSAAICGTDIRMYKNGYPGVTPESPRIIGHEIGGVIQAVGSRVKNIEEGMRVAVAPNIGCGMCKMCIRGDGHLCSDYRAFGINMEGGFAEYVVVPENAVLRGNVIRLDDRISFDEAALNDPLSCVYNGFLRCDIKPGDTVLVIGAGPIGVLHAMLAKMAGAARIFINDVSRERLDQCKEIDPAFIPVESAGLQESIMTLTKGDGVDVCVVACPVASVQSAALSLAAVNGRINFFGGLPKSAEPVALDTNLIHYRQLIVTGSARASVSHYMKTLGFIADGMVDVKKLITARFPLSEIHQAFEYAASGKGLKNMIDFD
jgi:L-iditol 2-dehydrogenase